MVLGLVGALPVPVALADVGGISVKWDKRSRMQTVVPRQRTDVRMLAEDVRLIPYFDPRFPEEPMMLVDARFDFMNPGEAQDVFAGFPEMLSQSYECEHDESPPRGAPDCYLPIDEWKKRRARAGTIEDFFVEVDGKPVPSKSLLGKRPYRRWLTFTVPIGKGAKVHVRTIFVVHPSRSRGSNQSLLAEGPGYDGWAIEYVLHTGATWSGPIGEGVVRLFQPGYGTLERRFRNLRPTRTDDLEARLGEFQLSVRHQRVYKSFEPSRLAQGGDRPAFAVDEDPSTVWRGEWLQIPNHCDNTSRGQGCVPIKGVRVTPAVGEVKPKALKLTCLAERDPDSKSELGTFSVPAGEEAQTIPLPKGTVCSALRLDATDGSAALADVAIVVDDEWGKDSVANFMQDDPQWFYGQGSDEEDIRSPVQTIAPAGGKTDVAMLSEEVRMVPYLDARFGDHPMVLVDARFELENSGKAQKLPVEFPEMLAVREAWNSDAELCCKEVPEERTISEPSDETFADISAEVDGVPARVTTAPGVDPVRRLFTFMVPLREKARAKVRVILVVRPSFTEVVSDSADFKFQWTTKYSFRAGGEWPWKGGKSEFKMIHPGVGANSSQRASGEDLPIALGALLSGKDDPHRPAVNALLLLQGDGVPAFAVDEAPDTIWRGRWIQIPVDRYKLIKGLTFIAARGEVLPRAFAISCILDYKSHGGWRLDTWLTKKTEVGTFAVPEGVGPQRILFPKSADCTAIRIESVDIPAAMVEVSLIE